MRNSRKWLSRATRRKLSMLAVSFVVSTLYVWRTNVIGSIEHRLAYSSDAMAVPELDLSLGDLIVSTPDDLSAPFHYLPLSTDGPSDFRAIPLPLGSEVPGKHFPTHIVRHPDRPDTFFVTDEVENGEAWEVRLLYSGQEEPESADVVGRVSTGGSEPAHAQVSSDGVLLFVSNYNSPVVSFLRLDPLRPDGLTNLPVPSTSASHPHQIIPHPLLNDRYYAPDLGVNHVHFFRKEVESLIRTRSFDVHPTCDGPRHGVVVPSGETLMLACQRSSSVLSLSLNPDGNISDPPVPALSTLPSDIMASYSETERKDFYALSDILHLEHLNLVLVANRRVKGPYDHTSGDTVAVFRSFPELKPVTHVNLGCWHPREFAKLNDVLVAVTCIGAERRGSGVVILDVGKREPSVIGRWDSPHPVWGVA